MNNPMTSNIINLEVARLSPRYIKLKNRMVFLEQRLHNLEKLQCDIEISLTETLLEIAKIEDKIQFALFEQHKAEKLTNK